MTGVLDVANYALSLYAVPPFIVAVGVVFLVLFVLAGEHFSRVSVAFALCGVSITLWLSAFTGMYLATDPRIGLWWAKTAYLGVPFIPAAIYQFTISVLGLDRERRWMVRGTWLGAAAFSASILSTDWLIAQVYTYRWGFYPKYGWLSAPYLVFFFGSMVLSLREYWQAYRRPGVSAPHRRRIRAYLVAFGVAYLGSVDYLAKYGVPLYPFGYLPIFGFIVLSARAIWRYHLVSLSAAFAAEEILATMHDAVVVCDEGGTIRVANTATERLFGYAEAELLGRPLERLAHGQAASLDRVYAALRAASAKDLELLCATKDGQPVTVNLSASQLRDHRGDVVGSVVVLRDITERQHAQQALAAKVRELERLNQIMVGREERILELKQEVQRLTAREGGNGSSARPAGGGSR
jgi:PAS domain S-box-containing protein